MKSKFRREGANFTLFMAGRTVKILGGLTLLCCLAYFAFIVL